MTLQVTYFDDLGSHTNTFRKIYKGKNYARAVEQFYGNQESYHTGEMIQLRGKERISLHTFGTLK